MKKQTVELVDPMTVNWPKEAFKVGMDVMVKECQMEFLKCLGLDPSKQLVFCKDDGSSIPLFKDHFGKERYVSIDRLVPLSKIQQYEAAKEHEAGIKRIMELDAILKADAANRAKLVKERADLAKKHLNGAGNGK